MRDYVSLGLLIALVFVGLVACVDYSKVSEPEAPADGSFRIPLGTCAEYQDIPVTFSGDVWPTMALAAGGDSKGCSGTGKCHNATTGLGGWNLGTPESPVNTFANIVNKTGNSGKTLIKPNDLENSYILIRLSQIENPMPQGGTLWFNTDLQNLKRWICQGAPNN